MYALNKKRRKEVAEKLLTVLQKEFKLNDNEANIALLDALSFVIAVRPKYEDRAAAAKVMSEYLPFIVEEHANAIHSTPINSANPLKCSRSN